MKLIIKHRTRVRMIPIPHNMLISFCTTTPCVQILLSKRRKWSKSVKRSNILSEFLRLTSMFIIISRFCRSALVCTRLSKINLSQAEERRFLVRSFRSRMFTVCWSKTMGTMRSDVYSSRQLHIFVKRERAIRSLWIMWLHSHNS